MTPLDSEGIPHILARHMHGDGPLRGSSGVLWYIATRSSQLELNISSSPSPFMLTMYVIGYCWIAQSSRGISHSYSPVSSGHSTRGMMKNTISMNRDETV